ncbi:MAG TPA: PadR family transcriptional regulator [Haliangiales bacterium]|nr:PadR family transcriptional regulator [Haliangiales bacterium]
MTRQMDVLKGTLDLMILKGLSWGPTHGYGLARWIRSTTQGALEIDDGALYPALHRLEDRGWIFSAWATTENNRKAKYYQLTADGRRQLRTEVTAWQKFAEAMHRIVAAATAPVGSQS